MSDVRKRCVDPDGKTHEVHVGPCPVPGGVTALTHGVLAKSSGGYWVLWSRHTNYANAKRTATQRRLKTGCWVIVELEDVPS